MMHSLIDRVLRGDSGYLLDDVAITPGVGASIAADSIGGANYQRVKLIHGADGANAGDVALTNPYPTQAPPIPTDLTEVALNIASSGDNSIVAGTAAQIIRVYMFWFKINGSGTGVSMKFRTAANDLHPALPFNDKDGWVLGFVGRPWFTCTVAEALQINLSAAIQLSGRLYYTKS